MQSSSVVETISSINNRNSGYSDNQLAYRLALMMEKFPPSEIPTPVLDTQERSHIIVQMRNTLSISQNAQSTEDYRRSLKEKYLKEYNQKFGLSQGKGEQTPSISNSTRVENLIAEKKKKFLQEILETKGRKLPLTSHQQPTPVESEQNEAAKKSLIPALMNILMTKGQDTVAGRVYEGISYRLNLLIREGVQRLSVWRKSDNQTAFSAYKVDGKEEYNVIQNNLSAEETQKLINFENRQRQQSQSQQPQPFQQQEQSPQNDNGPSME